MILILLPTTSGVLLLPLLLLLHQHPCLIVRLLRRLHQHHQGRSPTKRRGRLGGRLLALAPALGCPAGAAEKTITTITTALKNHGLNCIWIMVNPILDNGRNVPFVGC